MRTISRILSFLKKYKWTVALSMFAGAVCIICANLMPYMQQVIIDSLVSQNYDAIVKFSIYFVIIFLLRINGYLVQRYFAELSAQYTIYDIRNKLFDHIQRLSFTYHDEMEAGQLISRSTADTEAVRMFLGEGIVQIIHFTLIILSSLFFCFYTSWKLALACIIITPITGVTAWKYSHTIRPYFFKLQDMIGNMTTFLNQNFLGIKVIKSYVREDDQINQFTGLANKLFLKYVETSKVTAVYSPLISSIALVSQIIVFVYGGYLAVHDEMTVGGIVAFIGYFNFLLCPINNISMLVALLQNAIASGDRIFEVLKTKPEKIKDGKININHLDGNVEFKNVSFSYGDGFEALKNVNINVKSGQMVGIIGATGSGKTTLVNLLSRFYDVTEGELIIDGVNIKDYKLDSLRRHVGIVAQESFLFGDTIRSNISYPRNASLEEIIEAAKAANIHDYIMSLPDKYDTQIGERGVDLSGGQKQRMSIARAMLLNPEILILDDSTSALDTQTEALIQAAITNLASQRTTFMIAQRVSAIVSCDIIIVLDQGKIVEQGTHEELIKLNGYYNKIFQSQLLAKKEVSGGDL